MIQGNFKLSNDKTNKVDRIYKVREYTDYLIKKFEEHYYPGRKISIDETIIPYTGMYPGFTVFIKNKPINKGFLLYDIADPRNGYLLKAEIYAGRDNRNNNGLVITRTVRLLDKYLDKGHITFGDNFYTSIDLVQYLTTRKTGYVGTLRLNRDRANGRLDDGMKKGECRYYKSDAYPTLLLTLWWETILVKALSNCITPKFIFYKMIRHIATGNKYKESPLVFKEYSQNAKGVDLANNLVSTWRNIHRTSKWWHAIFIHYLTVTLNNSYIIYKYNQLKTKTKKSEYITRKKFIFILIRRLLNSMGSKDLKDLDFHVSNNKINFTASFRHSPAPIEGWENISKNDFWELRKYRPKCTLCNRKTMYCCKNCGDGTSNIKLCIFCFERYHKDLFLKSFPKGRSTYGNMMNY